MIDIKQYLEQTNTVLLTKDAFEYLKERASVPDKVKAEYDPSADLISREKTLTAFADYVGSGMSMDDYDALWDIVAKMPAVKQEPRFIVKSDGTIEQIKECTEQEPCGNAIDRAEAIKIASGYCHPANVAKELAKLPSVTPQQKTGYWIKKDGYSDCSECGSHIVTEWDYCPKCSAKMDEPQERSDKCSKCEYYINPDYTRCKECGAERSDKE